MLSSTGLHCLTLSILPRVDSVIHIYSLFLFVSYIPNAPRCFRGRKNSTLGDYKSSKCVNNSDLDTRRKNQMENEWLEDDSDAERQERSSHPHPVLTSS